MQLRKENWRLRQDFAAAKLELAQAKEAGPAPLTVTRPNHRLSLSNQSSQSFLSSPHFCQELARQRQELSEARLHGAQVLTALCCPGCPE